jgi:hypothetical protein
MYSILTLARFCSSVLASVKVTLVLVIKQAWSLPSKNVPSKTCSIPLRCRLLVPPAVWAGLESSDIVGNCVRNAIIPYIYTYTKEKH